MLDRDEIGSVVDSIMARAVSQGDLSLSLSELEDQLAREGRMHPEDGNRAIHGNRGT